MQKEQLIKEMKELLTIQNFEKIISDFLTDIKYARPIDAWMFIYARSLMR